MSKIFTPNNQTGLTDITVVKLRKCGKQFEIACYPNTVFHWRKDNKREEIDNVLQIDTIFTNVSKGQVAKKGDIVKAFGTEDKAQICEEILRNGKLQVSEQERQNHMKEQLAELASTISSTYVNPEMNRPYHVEIISNAISELHLTLDYKKSVKQLTSQIVKLLKEKHLLDIEKAKLKVRLKFSQQDFELFQKNILENINIESEEKCMNDIITDFWVDADHFRKIQDVFDAEQHKDASITILSNPLKEPHIIINRGSVKITQKNIGHYLKTYQAILLCCYLGRNSSFTNLLLPHYDRAADIINSKFGDMRLVVFGRVNCISDKHICDRYHIHSFPRLFCIINKTAEFELNCDRSTESILSTVRILIEMITSSDKSNLDYSMLPMKKK